MKRKVAIFLALMIAAALCADDASRSRYDFSAIAEQTNAAIQAAAASQNLRGESITDYQSAKIGTGGYSITANPLINGVASSCGKKSVACVVKAWSLAQSLGNRSVSCAIGYESSAAVSGVDSVAIACGAHGKVKGLLGDYIVAAEWASSKSGSGEWRILCVKAARVDGKKIMPGVWYKVKGGEFVETKDGTK